MKMMKSAHIVNSDIEEEQNEKSRSLVVILFRSLLVPWVNWAAEKCSLRHPRKSQLPFTQLDRR
jgi:hypothetical protein